VVATPPAIMRPTAEAIIFFIFYLSLLDFTPLLRGATFSFTRLNKLTTSCTFHIHRKKTGKDMKLWLYVILGEILCQDFFT
jgi:hypothetical protein